MIAWKGPYWEPRDIWVGVYWTRDEVKITRPDWSGVDYRERLTIYVCLVPCLPIRVRWWNGRPTPVPPPSNKGV